LPSSPYLRYGPDTGAQAYIQTLLQKNLGRKPRSFEVGRQNTERKMDSNVRWRSTLKSYDN